MFNFLGLNKRRQALRLWNQFCEFTSIAGFRFMTSKISLAIRCHFNISAMHPLYELVFSSAALLTFTASLFGLGKQLDYLVEQYMEDRVTASSTQSRAGEIPLSLVYICSMLNG
jgi:hypothetical protein